MFNSIYGMMVTKNIRSQVSFIDGIKEWTEEELKNDEIEDFLAKDKKDAFLSFSYGCWCTSFNRDALLRRVMALDSYVVYCDTDSCKLRPGYDKNIFEEYNNTVKERIENVSKRLGIDIKRYVPSDIKGIPHMIGIFEKEGKNEHTYERFITQGAKKYAFEEKELDKKTSKMVNKIHITVSGVPKRASVGLKKLEEFRDNYVFRYEDTNKNTLFYSDNQAPFELTDYLGNKVLVTDTSGVCLVPTSYTLGKALDYAYLLTDETTRRSKYIEEEY
jgi:hypothetical protein